MKARRSENIGIHRLSHRPRQAVLRGAILCWAGLLWASVAAGADYYEVIDLGTLSPVGINNRGQVVGTTTTTTTTNGYPHAFLWENEAMTDLGPLLVPLGGGNFSSAVDINNLGQVIGLYQSADYLNFAFLYENGGMKDLEGAFGSNTRVTGINDFGEMVGRTSASGCSGGCSSYSFLYDKSGGVRDLGNLGVGDYYYNDVTGINNLGQVVGYSGYYGTADIERHAFFWENGTMTDLGTLGGDYPDSRALDINNRGQVVGMTSTTSGYSHPFLWENGTMKDLNDLIDPVSGWELINISATAINDNGQIVGNGIHNGQVRAFLLSPPRRPVLIIPGIGATYSADTIHDLTWLENRGVSPSQLQIDPMTKVYDDLIQTLINVGYVKGKDLFVVNYDWRLPPGPDDTSIDGRIDGLSAAGISDQSYLYAVDYLGDILRQAAEIWAIDHPTLAPLDTVDVITHSTGGLVARTYLQSTAYGGSYASGKNLPKINNLIMIGVPNRGASKAWNPLHDNWVVDPAFQMVLSKIINRAYKKVLKGRVIGGPDYNINLASIISPNPKCQDIPEICFINQYVPTARALLATYDFIDFGSGFTNVNSDPGVRNSLLLDLNAGGDPNAFADPTKVTAKPTIIYGTNGGDTPPGETPTKVVKMFGPTSTPIGSHPIAEFAHFKGRDAGPGEPYYSDNFVLNGGDGTVPLISSRDQFVGDSRVTLMPFTQNPGGNTSGKVGHTDLPYNFDVQKEILKTLGVLFNDPADISINKHGYGAGAIQCAASCSNFGLDPVEGFMVDAQGRRLGFSAATGPLTEIPGSVWFGNTEGMGWVFGPVDEPLTVRLAGLGADYYVTASVLSGTGLGDLVDQGFLAVGETKVLPLPVGSQDSDPPIVTPPSDVTVYATEAGGTWGSAAPALAAFLAGGSAVDAVDPAPARLAPQISGVDADNNTLFPIGTTPVTFRFTDASGNIGTAAANVTVAVGTPKLSGKIIAKGRDLSGAYFVDLQLTDTGTGHARDVVLTKLTLRTLSGSGTVSYNTTLSPALPLMIGSLDAGTSTTIRLYLNVPATVTKFSITENGTLQDVAGTNYNYAIGQAVIP